MAGKRVAVLITDRQGEALRMSLGLLLLGDAVDVYVLGEVEKTDATRLHLETMKEFEVELYTTCPCGRHEEAQYLPTEEVARRLPLYDHALRY